MTKRFNALIFAAAIGLIIVAIGLGFLIGLNNPIPWILIIALILIPVAYKKFNANSEIVWKDEYSVGIEVLDNDHKKLIYLLNQFQTAYDYYTDAEFERQALEELVAYTRFHFEREEGFMKQSGYPDFENHKKQHESMILQVESFVEKYKREGHESLNEVSQFLTNWLLNHINGTDKLYSKHLIEKGIQ
ncbi:bacteriohemerythrin [Litoribacillus peritrichatus]|uniref:Hemerythrin-like domain-containing protein n=1 Tax=Litoribacillus peritrichatus TaxID=718191 RepID=A0ABP7MAE7_9GAMM